MKKRSSPTETEIKFEIKSLDSLEKQIVKMGGYLVHPEILQRTYRFDTKKGDLEKEGVFLRVRTGEKNILTVKRKLAKDNPDFYQRHEWETEVSCPEMAIEGLKNLGFEKVLVMEKYRKTYCLSEVLITLDRLPFGNFIEIEGEKEDINRAVKFLDLEKLKPITVTYWDLHRQHNLKHNLREENIVFQ